MVTVEQAGELTFEVQEVKGAKRPYRARLEGADDWWPAKSPRLALHGAAMTLTDGEVVDALGDLWEDRDG